MRTFQPDFEIVPASAAQNLEPAWAALETYAIEAAPFNLGALALPNVAAQQGAAVAVVKGGGGVQLAVPFRQRLGFDESLWSDITASGLPLLERRRSDLTIKTFARALRRPFLFRAIPTQSKFFAALARSATILAKTNSWQRAALAPKGDFEGWLAASFSAHRRKELRRLRARLAEQGALTFHAVAAGAGSERHMAEFLALEARGWKGRNKSALHSRPDSEKLFRAASAGLGRDSRLRFWFLRLNGVPIAALFGIVQGREAAIVKIAYDEAHARFSPGVLLMIDVTKALFAEGIALADSCADPDHPMIDHIWRERLEFADVLVAGPRVAGLQFEGARLARLAQEQARQAAKRLLRR
jgi:CelD/BcsL family acetyltransferase involved in cellulose biosynthesis